MISRPLPENVKLLEIDGILRPVASEFIYENEKLGPAFFRKGSGVYSLMLGANIKHSDTPNCMLDTTTDKDLWYLWTIEDVFIHDELTINYHLYLL